MPEWTNLRTSPLKQGSTLTRVILPAPEPTEAWHRVGVAPDPTFQNNWVNYDAGVSYNTAAFYKDAGRVYLKGLVRSGTLNGVIFTLPIGYRPAKTEIFAITVNDAFGQLRIGNNGDVFTGAATSNGHTSLDGISFRAA